MLEGVPIIRVFSDVTGELRNYSEIVLFDRKTCLALRETTGKGPLFGYLLLFHGGLLVLSS